MSKNAPKTNENGTKNKNSSSIERLTTNQKALGSNPAGRTRRTPLKSAFSLFLSFILQTRSFSYFKQFLAHMCHMGISLFLYQS